MSTAVFQSGARVVFNGTVYTLLRKVDGQLWQLEEEKNKRIHECTDESLRELYRQNELVFAIESDKISHEKTQAGRLGKAFAEVKPDEFEDVKLRRTYVKAVLNLPSSKDLIKPVIQQIWEKLQRPEHPPSPATVLRWKKRYLEGNGDFRALKYHADVQGNRSERYPQEVLQIVEKAVDEKFMTRERGTMQAAFEHAVYLTKEENKLRPEAHELPLPTKRLVLRVIDAIPAFDRHSARFGRVAATAKFRSVLAHRISRAPLERAEIDHTRMDMFVVDEESGLPLGRPYLTVCIDDYTRCILGVHIGFDPPSYFTVAQCLKDAFMPKTSLKQDYPDIDNDWQSYGVMRELVMDNGLEFHSNSLESACYSLGIELHYAPRKTGWFKGKIERFQGTFNREVAHGVPGTSFANILDKDDYDPAKHAIVRLSTLQIIARKWIADVYHQRKHRALGGAPAAVWRSSIKPEDIRVPSDPALLEGILGQAEQRRLTHKGIEFDGLFYNSPELTELRRLLGDTLDVEIRTNAADIGEIVVLSPDKKRMFVVPSISPEYAKGISRWQHKIFKRYAGRVMDAHDLEGWIDAKEKIAQLIQEDGLSIRRKKSNIRVARFKEHVKKADAPSVPSKQDSSSLNTRPAKQGADSSASNQVINPTDTSAPRRTSNAPRKKFTPQYRDCSEPSNS